jgi:hypothetical protein
VVALTVIGGSPSCFVPYSSNRVAARRN